VGNSGGPAGLKVAEALTIGVQSLASAASTALFNVTFEIQAFVAYFVSS
jgi:hypothetical protein